MMRLFLQLVHYGHVIAVVVLLLKRKDACLSLGVRQASEWLTKRNQVDVMLELLKRKDGGSQPSGRKLARKGSQFEPGRWARVDARMTDPQYNNAKDLSKFYTDLIGKGWFHLEPLLQNLTGLIALRDKHCLFTFTSHERLMFSAYPSYPDWADHEVVVIAPLRSGMVEVGFVDKHGRNPEITTMRYQELPEIIEGFLVRLTQQR